MKSRELINPIIEVISVMGLSVVIIFVPRRTGDSEHGRFFDRVVLLYAPIKKLSNLPVFFQQAAVGSERLIQLFNEKPTVVERPDAAPLKDFGAS